MLKVKIFFIVSLIFFFGASYICAVNFVQNTQTSTSEREISQIARPVKIFEAPADAAVETIPSPPNKDYSKTSQNPYKKNNKFMGITKHLLATLTIVLILPLIIAFMLIAKFNSMIKKATKTKNEITKEVQNAITNLENLENKFKSTSDFTEMNTNPDNLLQEIDSLYNEISKMDLDKVEIIPKRNEKRKIQYTQQEKKYKQHPIFSPPKKIQKNLQEPKLLSQKPITKTKGFYLVDCGQEKALFGYINEEIFLLNKFAGIANNNIHVRLTEKVGHKNIYLVKNGSYKALVQVEKEKMKVLLEM